MKISAEYGPQLFLSNRKEIIMNKKYFSLLMCILLAIASLSGCKKETFIPRENITTSAPIVEQSEPVTVAQKVLNIGFDYSDVQSYRGKPYCEMNGNVPYFVISGKAGSDIFFDICNQYNIKRQSEKITSFEQYGPLDEYGRCSVCVASVGKDIMPTEKREDINEVKPTGWESNTYRIKNRCHIIGFQLTGENDNKQNLFTGTRYLNVDGMLPFENEIADYVERTGNHIIYRSTPVFLGEELLARGILMEAYSVEDNGKGVQFCVFCYNVQPEYGLDYKTGIEVPLGDGAAANSNISEKQDFVINTRTKKFHLPDCEKVSDIADKNKKYYYGHKEDLFKQGYEACGVCFS